MAMTTAQAKTINNLLSGATVNVGTVIKTAQTKLDTIEESADVTDATNVAAALAAGASGAVKPANIEGLAATASTLRARTVLSMAFPFVAADFVSNNDIALTIPTGHAIFVTDVKCHLTTVEGGACTGQLFTGANGAGTAMSSTFDLDATNGDLLRTTTIGGQAVAAGGTIFFHASTNPATCAGVLVIEYVHTT